MNVEAINLILDALILIFLAITMVVAWRLSDSISLFRKTRKDMDRLVQDLARNIDKAELAITGLKSSTRDSGRDLQQLVAEARALSDELQLMTESGDNLASRLERLAERNRDIVERIEKAGGAGVGVPTKQSPLPRIQEDKRVPTGPSFAIRDRDADQKNVGSLPDILEEEDEDLGGFQSRAERELFAAITKGVRGKSGGGS